MLTSDIIQGFVGSVLAKRFDDTSKSPDFHKELWELCCSPFQYVAAAAPRGHAKSTAVSLAYLLCAVLFREHKYVLLVSDTESQSAQFLGNIKQELQENENIYELFGLPKDEKGLVKFIKDTETDIIVGFPDGHKFRIVAKGAEQKLRGLLWNGTRPDLVIVDDLENDELVMNKERRLKLRKWFYAALLPAMSPKGKFRMVGTILHMDSQLESLMPSPYNRATQDDGLKVWSAMPRGMWKSVKWRAHTPDYSKILWPERFNQEFFENRREDFRRQGIPEVYSQEYLNEPIDDSTAFFKKADFRPRTQEDKKLRLNYYITADLAISESERADWSVFLVAGVDEHRNIHIVNVIRDRLDGKEIVDLILALQRTYSPVAVGIEEMQVSKAIGPFLREEMIKQNTFVNMIPMKHMGKDKLSRARSIQARCRARGVKFDTEEDWYPMFEDECLKFPRSKHDDQVDAFSYMGLLLDKIIEAPTDKEVEDEEYELEMMESRPINRNKMTGY
ncbi:hypothetical protein [Microcystis sp. M42BS1]|uniref:phage terminase large subunit family protein n=1 Tax=Microcystis sp. M42BS1 TaxID=2771192 RepID=UPI0025850688|nr:hypothetical protein [Microcystis sp. M42BS1]MCA2570690.1 hypothetical protein [Microcystis sp. M42BS1]